MNNSKNKNPWIGLASYQEGDVLYGRDNEINNLSNWIITHTQTILCGRSGIGKTSILNAGISPIMRKNGFLPIKIRLEHNSTSYIEQIRECVYKEISSIKNYCPNGNNKLKAYYEETITVINKDNETLWEFFHRHIFYDSYEKRIIPLIIFDQFEEIFTIENDKKKINSFFKELADLLNDITPEYITEYYNDKNKIDVQAQNVNGLGMIFVPDITTSNNLPNYHFSSDFRIVITLRDDCLSYLEQHIRNIPALKQSKYFLQPINGEDAMSIIINPKPGLISKNVALRIISTLNNDSGIGFDDLKDTHVDSAILSLCLSQLFINKPENEETITLPLVEQFNNYIIDNFYTTSINDIPLTIIENLEDILVNSESKRECVSLSKLKENHIPDIYLNILINERKLLRKFTRNRQIMVEYIHDILCPVVEKRKQAREFNSQKQKDMILNERIKEIRNKSI